MNPTYYAKRSLNVGELIICHNDTSIATLVGKEFKTKTGKTASLDLLAWVLDFSNAKFPARRIYLQKLQRDNLWESRQRLAVEDEFRTNSNKYWTDAKDLASKHPKQWRIIEVLVP